MDHYLKVSYDTNKKFWLFKNLFKPVTLSLFNHAPGPYWDNNGARFSQCINKVRAEETEGRYSPYGPEKD